MGWEARQTQPHSPRLINRQQLRTGHRQEEEFRLEPVACELFKRKRGSCSGGLSPEVSQASVIVTSPSHHHPSVSPAPLLHPHLAVWNEKTPLFGVFAITMKAFYFPFKNSSLHSRGGICHPVPRLQTSPSFRSFCPEWQPCQTHENSPSGHLDKAQPLAKHEAILNATDSERRALVPGPNGPAKCMQLGTVEAAGVGGGGVARGAGMAWGMRRSRPSWPPAQAPPPGNLKGKFAFKRGS